MNLDGFSTACAMRDALRRRKISSRELVDLHAERIERHNPALNAINIPCLDRARDEAGKANLESALAGTPITIKDIFDVAGLPNTGGGVRPVEDGVVEKRRRLGRQTASGWRHCPGQDQTARLLPVTGSR